MKRKVKFEGQGVQGPPPELSKKIMILSTPTGNRTRSEILGGSRAIQYTIGATCSEEHYHIWGSNPWPPRYKHGALTN